jgi:hypothetical protein
MAETPGPFTVSYGWIPLGPSAPVFAPGWGWSLTIGVAGRDGAEIASQELSDVIGTIGQLLSPHCAGAAAGITSQLASIESALLGSPICTETGAYGQFQLDFEPGNQNQPWDLDVFYPGLNVVVRQYPSVSAALEAATNFLGR